jgi:hypothetical protein
MGADIMELVYCDYISALINEKLKGDVGSIGTVIKEVGPTKLDLHPTEGWFVSTKKTMSVIDKNGRKYKVTIEEELDD